MITIRLPIHNAYSDAAQEGLLLRHHAESHLDTDAAVAGEEIVRIQIIDLYSVVRFIT